MNQYCLVRVITEFNEKTYLVKKPDYEGKKFHEELLDIGSIIAKDIRIVFASTQVTPGRDAIYEYTLEALRASPYRMLLHGMLVEFIVLPNFMLLS